MIEVFFDGCCEPVNPGGTASFGVVILKDGDRIYEASKIFNPEKGREKETSNNVAEYSGLRDALQWLIDNALTNERIKVYGDSQLVIQQMWGTWGMNSGFYIPIAQQCKKMIPAFSDISGQWIPREENTMADELSKAELLKAGVKFRIQPVKKG